MASQIIITTINNRDPMTTQNDLSLTDCKVDFSYIISDFLGSPILICEHEQEIAFKASKAKEPGLTN